SRTLVGRHDRPALGHPIRDAIGNSIRGPASNAGVSAAAAESSKKYPAERQKSERLPERDLTPSEERRQKPVPEQLDGPAADRHEQQHAEDRDRSDEDPFPFHVSHVRSSRVRKLVVDSSQSAAQKPHS